MLNISKDQIRASDNDVWSCITAPIAATAGVQDSDIPTGSDSSGGTTDTRYYRTQPPVSACATPYETIITSLNKIIGTGKGEHPTSLALSFTGTREGVIKELKNLSEEYKETLSNGYMTNYCPGLFRVRDIKAMEDICTKLLGIDLPKRKGLHLGQLNIPVYHLLEGVKSFEGIYDNMIQLQGYIKEKTDSSNEVDLKKLVASTVVAALPQGYKENLKTSIDTCAKQIAKLDTRTKGTTQDELISMCEGMIIGVWRRLKKALKSAKSVKKKLQVKEKLEDESVDGLNKVIESFFSQFEFIKSAPFLDVLKRRDAQDLAEKSGLRKTVKYRKCKVTTKLKPKDALLCENTFNAYFHWLTNPEEYKTENAEKEYCFVFSTKEDVEEFLQAKKDSEARNSEDGAVDVFTRGDDKIYFLLSDEIRTILGIHGTNAAFYGQ